MKPAFSAAIQAYYHLEIVSCQEGPRQFVAHTYFLEDSQNRRFFCKIVDKPLFIPNLVRSLAALAEMHACGIERICYPIEGRDGFHLRVEESVIVLYNHIPAPQSETYSLHAFGKLLAEIHAVTPQITAPTSVEDFTFPLRTTFEEVFEWHVWPPASTGGPILQTLHETLATYEDEIRRFYARFLELGERCRQEPFEAVLTHDDAPGNVLVRSPEDIYLIDWDGLQRAPAERDTWLVDHFPDFLRGYRSVRPGFVSHPHLRSYAILSYYFARVTYLLVEILSEAVSWDNRLWLAQHLGADMFRGWMVPKLKEVWHSH